MINQKELTCTKIKVKSAKSLINDKNKLKRQNLIVNIFLLFILDSKNGEECHKNLINILPKRAESIPTGHKEEDQNEY